MLNYGRVIFLGFSKVLHIVLLHNFWVTPCHGWTLASASGIQGEHGEHLLLMGSIRWKWHETGNMTGFGEPYAGTQGAQQKCVHGIQQGTVRPNVHQTCQTSASPTPPALPVGAQENRGVCRKTFSSLTCRDQVEHSGTGFRGNSHLQA